MTKRCISLLLIAILILIKPVESKADNYGLEEPLNFAPPVVDVAKVGYGIQRTMRLLETSTPENKNIVRIAFCGQSITDASNNKWPAAVISYIKEKYPHAIIQSVNFGIGGYNTWLQQNIIENDITSFYPDLTFFYDYGDMAIYSNMIQFIRENTVSEVIIQNDHLDNGKGEFGSDAKSFTSLPLTANRFNCELADIRTHWKKYLDTNSLSVSAMLSDNVHLNNQGQALMFEILKQYLVYKPVDEKTFDDRTNEYYLNKDVSWSGNKISLPFTGNRIELHSNGKGSTPVNTIVPINTSIKINGKKPSSYIELCNSTRYSNLPDHVYQSYFMKIVFLKPAKAETWEIEFTRVNPQNKNDCDYKVTGSRTGFDGNGNTLQDFTTKSGTFELRSQYFYNVGQPTVGKKLVFQTTINGSDAISLTGIEKIASNLPSLNNKLELTLNSSFNPFISGYFKSYRPGILMSAPIVNPINIGDTKVTGWTKKNSKIEVNIGGCNYLSSTDRNGNFNVKIPKIKKGVIIQVVARLGDYKSQLYKIKMAGIATAPIIKKINSIYTDKKIITGVATKGSTVIAKIGKTSYKGTATTLSGAFSIKVPKLKTGTKIVMSAYANGVTSKTKSVVVKRKEP